MLNDIVKYFLVMLLFISVPIVACRDDSVDVDYVNVSKSGVELEELVGVADKKPAVRLVNKTTDRYLKKVQLKYVIKKNFSGGEQVVRFQKMFDTPQPPGASVLIPLSDYYMEHVDALGSPQTSILLQSADVEYYSAEYIKEFL